MTDGESAAAETDRREREESQSLALRVTDLGVSYGHVAAVHSVSFTIGEGECIAIVGPNGNGKSSVVMGVAGLVARRGRVEIFGRAAPSANVMFMAQHGLTLVPERRQLYPRLSVADNIILGNYSRNRSLRKARRSESYRQALELFPELKSHMTQKAGTLSGGEQQMVAIARGLAADPRILAVDEPCLGLAEAVSRRVYDALAGIHAQGRTLLIVEEAPARALELATRQVEIRNGVVVGGAS
ncbi:MAG TPA: ATP-binding cassette domain-containing protein [Solirubrobacteraceae bacterium]|jgi:branched-chain amino acid transport system ATP-binding protein